MTGDEAAAIRKAAGLTLRELAALCRLTGEGAPDAVRAWERGAKPVSGPISVILDLLRDGTIDPAPYRFERRD